MKKITLIATVLLMMMSCSDDDRKVDGGAPENEVDAARDFIRAALDGKFDEARKLMVDDSINQQDLDVSERLYKERMSPEEKAQYKGASIHIYEAPKVNDSTTIVYYANTYRNQKDSLKVIRRDNKWLVDFKYIFKYKEDTLQ
jgi:hypothetical protein